MKDAIIRFGNRKAALKVNIRKIFGLIWGQFTTSAQTLVKGQDSYRDKKVDNDVSWLTDHLRWITSGVDNKSDKVGYYIQAL
eukprot:3846271-Ditylum_brightwellii.AAC.1